MDKAERLHLQKMINANNVKDQTLNIRQLKHSNKILRDVRHMQELKKKYTRLDPKILSDMCFRQCSFLSSQYTDLYNKLYKDELNIEILYKFIRELKAIEEGDKDQHEASFTIGKLLKELYIDSALRKAEKLNKEGKKIEYREAKRVNWRHFNVGLVVGGRIPRLEVLLGLLVGLFDRSRRMSKGRDGSKEPTGWRGRCRDA